MCIICASNDAQSRPSEDQLVNAACHNGDGGGWGIVFKDKKGTSRIKYKKSMVALEVIDSYFAALDELGDRVQAHTIHFRIATHGGVNLEGCHPFKVPGERVLISHNGVLPVYLPETEHRSDTRYFAEETFPTLGGVRALHTQVVYDVMSAFVRDSHSKMTILSAEPRTEPLTILGENLGHWEKARNIWWSNYTYNSYPTYSAPSNSKGLSAIDAWWDDDVADDRAKRRKDAYDTFSSDYDDTGHWFKKRRGRVTSYVRCANVDCPSMVDIDASMCQSCGWCQDCESKWEECLCLDAVRGTPVE